MKRRRAAWLSLPPAPLPQAPEPVTIDHVFEPYTLGSLVICIHLDGIHPCGRPEAGHVPAPREAEAG